MNAALEIITVSSFRTRLYELMRHLGISGQENFAKYLDVSFNTLKEVFRDESGKRALSLDNIAIIVDKTGCDYEWFARGKGEPFPRQSGVEPPPSAPPLYPVTNHPPQPGMVSNRVVFIPKIRRLFLVKGDKPDGNNETEWFAWPHTFLSPLTKTPDALRILRLEDDLMYPLLKKDDIVMLDCSQKDVGERAGIYAFVIGTAMQVSELEKLPRGRLMVRPHNAVYSSFDIAEEAVRVIGRCIWYGRTL